MPSRQHYAQSLDVAVVKVCVNVYDVVLIPCVVSGMMLLLLCNVLDRLYR